MKKEVSNEDNISATYDEKINQGTLNIITSIATSRVYLSNK